MLVTLGLFVLHVELQPNQVLVLVVQSCLTLCDPMACSLPDSSVHGIFQARILEWVATPFSRGSSDPGIQPGSPALQAYSLLSEPPELIKWPLKVSKSTFCYVIVWFYKSSPLTLVKLLTYCSILFFLIFDNISSFMYDVTSLTIKFLARTKSCLHGQLLFLLLCMTIFPD